MAYGLRLEYHSAVRRLAPLLLLPLLTGCVDRLISLKSDPPQAEVFLDGEPVGATPMEIPYVWYGTREIVLVKRGYESARQEVVLNAPWWQVFPFDFITDVLLPVTLTDRTEVEIKLVPALTDRKDMDSILERARKAREKVLPEPPPK